MAAYTTYTDQQLLDLIRTGDQAAFTEIYDRYSGILYRYANRWLKDRETIKDVIQELFTVLWTKRETLAVSQNLSGYLYVAVRNAILRKISEEKRADEYSASLQHFIDSGQNITDHKIREAQLRAIIEKEISALPEKMRQIFEMSRTRQMSHDEIARELGISEHTVRTQVKRALRVLRGRLGILVYIYLLTGY
ncbi:RNA polymerase sigma factor [Pedobacter deserti]|uniref:RNA polymerase sigma factor n=1 Tax=Pedobacter deserti TaxID=2817382 RepID=UPI00210E3CB1